MTGLVFAQLQHEIAANQLAAEPLPSPGWVSGPWSLDGLPLLRLRS